MNWFLLVSFMLIASAMVAPAIWRRDYRLQFPCLAGLTVLYQVALPLASLNTQPNEVSAVSLTRFSVMAILCLLAAWTGYEWWPVSNRASLRPFDSRRLVISAIILAALGGFFTLKYNSVTPEYDPEAGGMTGIATIYLTLASVARYGFMLAAILILRTRNWKLLFLLLPQLWIYFQLFMIGRRGPTGEIAVIVCLLLFFYRKWAIPLWLLALGTLGMAIFCFNIGLVRNTVDQPLQERIAAIEAADPLHAITVKGMAESRGFVEVLNATRFMEAKAEGGHYTLGFHFWNQLVFGFVPAQFVGREFKESLKIPLTDDTRLTGFEKPTGTCETGIGEAFMAYGYFGCGLFFVLGGLMRRLWEGATRDSVSHQFLLMLFTLPAVISFSGQLWTMLNLLVTIGIFAGPLLWWSRSTNPGVPNRIRVGKPAPQT